MLLGILALMAVNTFAQDKTFTVYADVTDPEPAMYTVFWVAPGGVLTAVSEPSAMFPITTQAIAASSREAFVVAGERDAAWGDISEFGKWTQSPEALKAW